MRRFNNNHKISDKIKYHHTEYYEYHTDGIPEYKTEIKWIKHTMKRNR
jgi:hypothetical protein